MKTFFVHVSLLMTLAFCLAVAPALADTLELLNGQAVEGKYLGGTDAKIDILVAGHVQSYNITDVHTLTFGKPSGESNENNPATHPANTAGNGLESADTPTFSPPASADTANASAPAATRSPQTIEAGTTVVVRMIDSVDSSRNKAGDPFRASLEEALVVNDTVVAPKGADVYGHLVYAQEAGHIEGKSELRLALTGINIHNQVVPIVTGAYDVAGKSRGTNSAEKIGGGAALGALIGAIAGHGKGAAIGAGVGAATGTVVQVVTHGEEVHVPSETVLNFTLEQPATIPAAAGTEGLSSETRSR
jgi:hypothetical protein